MYKTKMWIAAIALTLLACGGELAPVAANEADAPSDPFAPIGFYGVVWDEDYQVPLEDALVDVQCPSCGFEAFAITDAKGRYWIMSGSHEGHHVSGCATWGKWGQGIFLYGCGPAPVEMNFHITRRPPEARQWQ